MKRFIVFYSNNVESSEMGSFDTLDEARAYCDEQVRGEEESNGDYNDKCLQYCYEVYDSTIEDFFSSDPVYATKLYWDKRP